MKRTAYSVSVFFKEFRSYGILFLRFSFPFSSIYFQLPSSNLQNPSTSKFQTFLSPLPPPSNRLISLSPPSFLHFFFFLPCFHLHLASQFQPSIRPNIPNNPTNFSRSKKSKRVEERNKKEEGRGGRNEATLERGKGEETVRPGIESVSNGHEHGASRRQASSAD